jgi:hypothetical protein
MSRKLPSFEANVFTCRWDERGTTGKLDGADRIFAPTTELLARHLLEFLRKEIERVYPAMATVSEVENLPVKFRLDVLIERRSVTVYGK